MGLVALVILLRFGLLYCDGRPPFDHVRGGRHDAGTVPELQLFRKRRSMKLVRRNVIPLSKVPFVLGVCLAVP